MSNTCKMVDDVSNGFAAMPLDSYVRQAKELRARGADIQEIREVLRQYGASVEEAERALKEIQKEERKKFSPSDW